jgi:nitrous-oxide reductase
MEQEGTQKYLPIAIVAVIVLAVVAVIFLIIRQPGEGEQAATDDGAENGAPVSVSGDAAAIAQARGLTPDDINAALMTYTPSGKHDPYVMFASGGHSGQVYAVGVPSMRILKQIAVFTPEPWQGYGYGAQGTMDTLAGGNVGDHVLSWGDTHHPALSETAGEYDGQFLFINDKANARVAVIDLRDFETKQILKNPVAIGDHGGGFVTPNTEFVIEGGQYAAPLGWEYAPVEQYEEVYRGMITVWKFDRESGRINYDESFAMELPPYWQDLCDAGKKVSEGWIFCNSINTEMATGGIELENPPFEAGTTQNDMDYLHIINVRKAAEVAAAGNTTEVNGFPVISLQTSIDEGLLYFAPEPKSPHGVDVAPGGDYMVVAGKLDPHVTIYSFEKIQAAIAARSFTPDQFGVPVLDFDAVMEAQVELGLGPLHTQFGPDGYAYTSLFLDSAVARWTLGGPYDELNADAPWSLVHKVPVQYNVGHIAATEGDTVSPDGSYLVALNKWAIDRFLNVGPLLPQNLQLIDTSQPGATLKVLYDLPVPDGEPHYAQIISADKLNPWEVYPEVGWDPAIQAPAEFATAPGEERVERDGNKVTVWMTAIRSHYTPERVELQAGDEVTWHITNLEQTYDATHGFSIPVYNINLSLEPGETESFSFTADQPGVFSYYCTEFCSALHLEMHGYMTIQPE